MYFERYLIGMLYSLGVRGGRDQPAVRSKNRHFNQIALQQNRHNIIVAVGSKYLSRAVQTWDMFLLLVLCTYTIAATDIFKSGMDGGFRIKITIFVYLQKMLQY